MKMKLLLERFLMTLLYLLSSYKELTLEALEQSAPIYKVQYPKQQLTGVPSLNMLGHSKMYSIFHIKRQGEKTAKGVQPL